MKLCKLFIFIFFIIADMVSEIAKNEVVVLVSSCFSIAAVVALIVLEICESVKIKKANREENKQ